MFLVDEAVANQIIEKERLKSAESRLELYDREGRHMCIMPGCRNPVIGKLIFAHCLDHLERYEQRWLEENLESGMGPSADQREHPVVELAKKALAERDLEIAKEHTESKIRVLNAARQLVNAARVKKLERRAYLPQKLRERIERVECD